MLTGLRPFRLTLPAQVFFTPTKAFATWIKKQQRVFDCGAGMGLLGSKWPKIVVGLDLHTRDQLLSAVYMADACTFPYPKDSIVLLARPSHGPWTDDVIHQAWQCGAHPYYAGLPRNYETDLSGYERELVVDKAGEEGEQLWRITGECPTA